MSDRALAAATLDTFPINVAVLNGDGEIVFTNRAWREFARAEGGVEDHERLGTNYLDAADVDDEYATAAVEGLRAVLAGDREEFTLEYPCHSPTERRWFLMRASSVEVDGRRHAVVAHANITDRKEAELAAEERADQLERLLERVDGLVREATAAVVGARSRPAVEERLCEAVVEAGPYTFAWVGRPDLRAESLVPRAWSGEGPADVEARTLSLSTATPAAEAHRSGELQVATATSGDGEDAEGGEASADDAGGETTDGEGGEEAGDDAEDGAVATDGATAVDDGGDPLDGWAPVAGARAVAAVPLTYRSKRYGVLSVYADEADAFDVHERTVLAALGDVAGTAVHAVTSGQVLDAATVVEVEVSISAPEDYPGALTAGADRRLVHHDAFVDGDGTVRVVASVTGDTAAVLAAAGECPDVTDARVLTERDGAALYEFAVAEPLVATVADFDGVTTALSAADGTVEATFSFPDETAARAAFEHLRERYGGVDLSGYRERERANDTGGGFRAELEASLTDRQLTALRTAYYSGYFEWPREVSGEEVADSMGITRATFHQHLREATRKLAAALLEFDLE